MKQTRNVVEQPANAVKCYRTACNNPHDNCRHTQMGTLYCEACAMLINRANPEVPGLVSIPRLEQARKAQTSK
jgi:late competence protein required for DNA uptake (superfamily II DNA/RNA helicase)